MKHCVPSDNKNAIPSPYREHGKAPYYQTQSGPGGVWMLIYCILVDIMTGYYLPQCVCNGSTAGSQASQDQSADKQICRVLHHALQQTR